MDRNGEVSKSEVLEIITAIFKMIPEEERLQLPEDENSPQKRADKLWARPRDLVARRLLAAPLTAPLWPPARVSS